MWLQCTDHSHRVPEGKDSASGRKLSGGKKNTATEIQKKDKTQEENVHSNDGLRSLRTSIIELREWYCSLRSQASDSHREGLASNFGPQFPFPDCPDLFKIVSAQLWAQGLRHILLSDAQGGTWGRKRMNELLVPRHRDPESSPAPWHLLCSLKGPLSPRPPAASSEATWCPFEHRTARH